MRRLAAGAAMAWVFAVAILAVAVAGTSLQRLAGATDGLTVSQTQWDGIPVTIHAPAGSAAAAPVVVIAHGFAGSQQLMQPFAVTLARNGFIAVTFDFPGHGRNPAPLPGSLRAHDALLDALMSALARVSEGARTLPGADGRLALVGHSMASDLVVRHAQANPAVAATVGVSLVYGGAEMRAPRNLLAIYGSLEPDLVQSFGRRLVAGEASISGRSDTPAARDGRAAAEAVPIIQPGVTYGRFDDGSARRLVLAAGAEHIGVLYHATSLRETLDWLDRALLRPGAPADGTHAAADPAKATGFVDARGPAIGALLFGIVALAWPLSRGLRRMLGRPDRETRAADLFGRATRPLRRREWLAVTVLPALIAPAVLRVVPTAFLPILLGDYLLLHFALYGALTGLGIVWLARRQAIDIPAPRLPAGGALLAALAVLAWSTLATGLPIDRYMFNLWPAQGRGVLILALLVGTLIWFCTDEWLTRHPQAPRWAYPFTKLCFIVSLMLAVSLDLSRLFFLIIIIPAILLMFIIYGLFSRWSFQATGSPWPAALANACVFAWGIAVTFPAISR